MQIIRYAVGLAAVAITLTMSACTWSGPDEAVAAGQRLHEETAGGVGCASCHGINARGEGLAPDIRGVDLDQIMDSLKNTEDMRDIFPSRADVNNLVAYFSYLKDKAKKS